MRGGRMTAEAAGLKVQHRDEIFVRISALPEGTLFRREDILGGDIHMSGDFTLLRNHDYLEVFEGWCVGIVETDYLRRPPKLDLVLSAFQKLEDCSLYPTGDRLAWQAELREWEPLQGYRYYTEGTSRLLSLGGVKIRIMNAPAWLRDETPEGELLRICYDTEEKGLPALASRIKATRKIGREEFKAAIALAEDISEQGGFEDSKDSFEDPLIRMHAVQSLLKDLGEKSQ
jgi:hypothetical protein